jgi:hypothetical protein
MFDVFQLSSAPAPMEVRDGPDHRDLHRHRRRVRLALRVVAQPHARSAPASAQHLPPGAPRAAAAATRQRPRRQALPPFDPEVVVMSSVVVLVLMAAMLEAILASAVCFLEQSGVAGTILL